MAEKKPNKLAPSPVAAPDAPGKTLPAASGKPAADASPDAATQAVTAGFAAPAPAETGLDAIRGAAAATASAAKGSGPALAGPAGLGNGPAPGGFPGAGGLPAFLKDFDVSKMFGGLKAPALPDMESVLATHRRNLEALSDANRVALEGAQAVGRRHFEIMQATMAELSNSVKSLSVAEPPATRAARQAELLKHAYENAVTNTRELGDLIQKANSEAMQKLNHRFSEAMNEVKTLFNKL